MAKAIILGGLFDKSCEHIKITERTAIKRGISNRWYIIPDDASLEGL